MNDFNCCPVCKSPEIDNINGRKWVCKSCGYTLYFNVASSVALIITDDDGNVLFEKRAKEPGKGLLALPGGFCDPDESAEEACLRECIEETGVKPVEVNYVTSRPNTYPYKGITYKTCDLFFEAKLPESYILKPQASEVTSFEKHSLKSLEDLNKLPLAFDSAKKALSEWINKKS